MTPNLKVRKHRADFLLILLMAILMMLGLIVIYSISPALTARLNAAGNTLDQNHFMYRQVLYLSIGLGAFLVTAFMPIDFWRKHQTKLLVMSLILCLVPIVAARNSSLVLCTNGACRWINLGFVSLQPAEVLKFTLVIFLAGFLASRIQSGKLDNTSETLLPIGVILGFVAILVVGLQKDLGTGLAIFGIAVTMLFMGGLKLRYFLIALFVTLAAGALFTLTSSHRLERISTFMHSSNNKETSGYHINQALIAVGSGGVSGTGLGNAIQAYGYLPEAANDSIFAIVAEQFGFVGTIIILILFSALFLRLIKVMDYAGSNYHKLLMAGIFGWVFTHAIVNIGAMLGIFPLTGITLPFLSFGGTSLLFIMAALGLAFQISRYTFHTLPINQQERDMPYEDRRRRRGIGRARYAGSGSFE